MVDGAGRCAHEYRSPTDRTDRRTGQKATYRALPQRSGGNRYTPLPARAIDRIAAELTRLQHGTIELAAQNTDTIMPGFTHLQTAQPVSFGHHLLAWNEMLERDYGRLMDCRARLNQSPLGAAALAGTTYPIDREHTAAALGFDKPTENSLDSVSDRDFAIEFCAFAALLMTHLSRISEELVLWTSAQFNFIELPDRFCTGSSIMPQKEKSRCARAGARQGRAG